MKKIYADDPLVHYKNSEVSPERTKAEIDGILAEWGIKDTQWHWDPDHNDVWLQFRIQELHQNLPIMAVIKVTCPAIWNKASPRARPPREEQINWRVSMRAMFWFIKTHLEMAYAMQSDKIRAFLSYVKATEDRDLGDVVIPRLQKIPEIAALPEGIPGEERS